MTKINRNFAILCLRITACLCVMAICRPPCAQAQLSNYIAKAQEYMQAPEVWSFMRYGSQEQNLYTGTPRVSVPIYAYQDMDFTIPISMNYASDGLKVNIPASSVGLGWFLNAGGMITREVRGVPDEYVFPNNYPEGYDTGLYGYYHHFKRADTVLTNIFSRASYGLDMRYRTYGFYYNVPASTYETAKKIETTADIFSFNFMGHSGKFMMGQDENGRNIIRVFETNSPQGEFRVDLSDFQYSRQKQNSSIKITTGDGYVFTFGTNGADSARFHSMYDETVSALSYDYTPPLYYKPQYSSEHYSPCCKVWLLTKITAPNGREVTLTYNDAEDVTACMPYGEKKDGSYWNAGPVGGRGSLASQSTLLIKRVSRICQLDKINIDDKCAIQFYYSDRQHEKGYFPDSGRVELRQLPVPKRLDSIVVVNSRVTPGVATKRVLFDYYLYNHNTGDKNPKLLLRGITFAGQNPETYTMTYHGIYTSPSQPNRTVARFPVHGCTGDHWGYFNGDYTYIDAVMAGATLDMGNNTETLFGSFREPNAEAAMMGMLQKITYPTGGYSEFEYEGHDAFQVIKRNLLNNGNNLPRLEFFAAWNVGGLRIKKISDYSDSRITTRNYSYENSGILLKFPRYKTYFDLKNGNTTLFHEVNSIYGIELQTKDASHIEYKDVTETYDNGSCVRYHFSNYEEIPDKTDLFDSRPAGTGHIYKVINPAQYYNHMREMASMHANRGKMTSKTVYNSVGQPVEKITYTYDKDKELPYVNSIGQVGDLFYEHRTYVGEYPLKSTESTRYLNGQPMTQTTTYSYNKLGQVTSQMDRNPDGKEITSNILYVSDIKWDERNAVDNSMINYNVLQHPIEQRIILGSGYGSRMIQAIHNTFNYSAGAFFLNSIASAKLHQPIEPTIISTEAIGYNPPVLAIKVDYVYDEYLSIDQCFTYGEKGRVREVVDPNKKTVTTYLWGYDNLYPVAKIENATYDKVKAVLPENQIKNIAAAIMLNEATQLPLLESLRTNLPNAQVTIYLYKPLAGIARIIDPSGRNTYYEYDDQNRLKAVKDDKGNLLNEYEYHFKE